MTGKHHRRAGAPADQERPRARPGFRFVITIALIALVAGVIVVGAVTRPAAQSPAPPDAKTTTTTISVPLVPTQQAPPQNAESPSSVPSGRNPNIPNPQPWQYDPATDQHWDPDHGHWHAGRPPSMSDPEPWQYDPESNKYWHPRHKHWHNGQPPPPDQR